MNRQWMFPKLRQWTLRATVDLGFAVCDWFVPDFYVYLSLVFSACYYWWICLLVWLLFFFFYFFKIYFIFIYLFIFFLFFLLFLLSCVADRVLVLWLGVRSGPPRWESRVQDTGPPETSQPHVISIGEGSPRDLRLNTKTQLHPMARKLQCWMPCVRQLARQGHNPTH